jgi:renalase
VDVGAAYLTATGEAFRTLVGDWVARGLLRAWTDTLATAEPTGRTGSTTGPMRYAAPLGLRALVEGLAAELPVLVHPHEVEAVSPTGRPGLTG